MKSEKREKEEPYFSAVSAGGSYELGLIPGVNRHSFPVFKDSIRKASPPAIFLNKISSRVYPISNVASSTPSLAVRDSA